MCTMAIRIKKCRLENNLTQEELAEKLGLKKSAVAKYENGRVEKYKTFHHRRKMARIFDCTPSYLMGWDNMNTTVAAHKDGDNFTPEELQKIEEYKKLLIAARPKE